MCFGTLSGHFLERKVASEGPPNMKSCGPKSGQRQSVAKGCLSPGFMLGIVRVAGDERDLAVAAHIGMGRFRPKAARHGGQLMAHLNYFTSIQM